MSNGNHSSVCITLIFILAVAAKVFSQIQLPRTLRHWQTRIPNVNYFLHERSINYTKPVVKIISTGHPASSGFQNASSLLVIDSVTKSSTWAMKIYNITNASNEKTSVCFLTNTSLANHDESTVLKVLKDRDNKIVNKTNPIDLYIKTNIPITYNDLKEPHVSNRIRRFCKYAAEKGGGVYNVTMDRNLTATYKSKPLDLLGLIPDDMTQFPKSQHIKVHIQSGIDLTGGRNPAWPN